MFSRDSEHRKPSGLDTGLDVREEERFLAEVLIEMMILFESDVSIQLSAVSLQQLCLPEISWHSHR